jgi:gliding motility-associated-like protein
LSGLQNPTHLFPTSTVPYTVKLKIRSSNGCSSIGRSRQINPRGLLLDADFEFTGVCDSGFIRFKNTSVLNPDTAWYQTIWDFGDGNTSTLNDPVNSFAPGNYTVRLTIKTTTACLDQTLSRPVIMQAMDIQAPSDFEINAGESVQLNVTGGGTRFLWSPPAGLSSTTVANPVAKPSRSTMYVITAYNDAGCTDMDSVFVKIKPVPGIYVPTGFTPNNDGKNDVFRPSVADEYVLHEFSIYNRWGQKIFSTSQKETGWNGKVNGILQNPGVYVWVLIATETQSGKKEERKGTFVIIR